MAKRDLGFLDVMGVDEVQETNENKGGKEVNLNIKLPVELRQKAKAKAATEGVTLAAYIAKLIEHDS